MNKYVTFAIRSLVFFSLTSVLSAQNNMFSSHDGIIIPQPSVARILQSTSDSTEVDAPIKEGSALLDKTPDEVPPTIEEDTVKYWTIKGGPGLSLSQTSLTNWAAGGENTLAGHVFLRLEANYAKQHWIWENNLNTEFGLTYTQSNKLQKSVDKIEITTKPGYKFSEKFYTAAMVNFLTQYTRGYEKPGDNLKGKDYISTFMTPGYLNASVGMEYKPIKGLSIYYAPLTSKTTFVLDPMLSAKGVYGVKPGAKLFAELGTSFVANAQFEFAKGFSFMSKLTLFTAYTHNFGNIDVNWDALLAYKIAEYFSVMLNTSLLYDDDIRPVPGEGPKVQFREMFSIGIGYNF